ncbi:MAG: alpha-isopropylmalate synthase regulatory domain-containing protein, partial [Candidatus Woesearchaeota archaeon]
KPEQDSNLNAVLESKAKTACMFGKTWLNHISNQLKITPEDNLKAIKESIKYLIKNNLEVLYDAEHFFDGYKDNKNYAIKCIDTAFKSGAKTVILCDTNGGCIPQEVLTIMKQIKKKFPGKEIGVHFHNDSGCAVANTLISAPYASHIQGTINGFGERCGNADLCQIIPGLELKLKKKTNINLSGLKKLSDMVYLLSNNKENPHQPYVGANAFSHKAGTHVDAISKGAICEHINPELIGNKRNIILSALSGTANVITLLNQFNIKADKKDKRVKTLLHEIKELESAGYDISNLNTEKYLLIHKHFIDKNKVIKIDSGNWKITTGRTKGKEFAECTIKAEMHNKKYSAKIYVKNNGPVDAAYNAMKQIIMKKHKEIKHVNLTNFKVMIAHDKGVESSVRVYIEFKNHNEEFETTGVSTNIIEASIEAIAKGFRYYLLKNSSNSSAKL